MLQWICPECGRECEPAERDCPVCYPQAEAMPAPPPIASKAAKAKVPEPVAKPAVAPVVPAAPPISVPPPLLPLEFSSPAVAKAAPVPPPIPVLAQELASIASVSEPALDQLEPLGTVPPPMPVALQQEAAEVDATSELAFELPAPAALVSPPIPALIEPSVIKKESAPVSSVLELVAEQPEPIAAVPPPIPAAVQQESVDVALAPEFVIGQVIVPVLPIPVPAQDEATSVLSAPKLVIEDSAPIPALEPVAPVPPPIPAAVQQKAVDVASVPEPVEQVLPPIPVLSTEELAPVASVFEPAFEQLDSIAPVALPTMDESALIASVPEPVIDQLESIAPVPRPAPVLTQEEAAVPPPIPEFATEPSPVEPAIESAPAPKPLTSAPSFLAASRHRFAPPAAPVTPQPPPPLHAMSQLRMPLAVPPSAPCMHAPVALDPASVRGSYPVPPLQPEPSFPQDAMSLEALLDVRDAEPRPGAASSAALELESGSTLVAVLDPPESTEPPELPTAKFPIPNLQPPAALQPQPQPQPQPEPDPVPAGLTALSATMKAFDDRTRRVDVTAAAVLDPIPAPAGEILLDLANHETPTLLRNGSFELYEGQLRPLTLPDVATPPQDSHSALEADSQWLPLRERAKPQPPRGVQELEFDPALLQYMEEQEEQEAELRAMDAVGLAPLSPLVFEAASKPPSGPGLRTGSVQFAAWQTEEIVVVRSDGKPRVDEDLRQRVAVYEAEQHAIRELTTAASKSAPMLVFADAISRIGIRRPGPAASPQPAFRGFTPWPPMGPTGRPVSAFEMEFDAAVLNRVQEWEESRLARESEAQELKAETAPIVESAVEAPAVEPHSIEVPTTTPVEPLVEVVTEPVLQQALVAYGTVEEESEQEEVVLHALTPIVEVTVPPIAKMTKLPGIQLQPMGVKPRLRQSAPQAEFSEFSPLVPTIGKLVKIIPSPIMNIQHSKVMAPPGWLVTAAIALLIPITALGVVNYWILPSQRGVVAAGAPAATAAVSAPPPTANPSAPPAKATPLSVSAGAPWQKQLEFTGLRLQNSTVKCLVVNHGKDTPALHLLVTLRSSRGANDPPVGTFKVRLSPLGAGSSREIAEPISFTPPMRSIDWSDLRSDVDLLKP